MRESRFGSVEYRFSQRFVVNETTGCWEWSGAKNAKGYGLIGGEIDGKRYAPIGRRILAHRVSWIIYCGDIPARDGHHGTAIVMHKCDNPACVNPDHLQLGSQSDNVNDMIAKGRKSPAKPKYGLDHWHSSFKSQEEIDLICSTVGQTKELAERFGVAVSTIKRVRSRNGVRREDAAKFVNKPLTQEAVDHIRSTKPGTRGLGKLYGVGKTTIANIRKGLTHAG